MSKIMYQIKFLTYWQAGSGLSSGIENDALPIKDINGLPYYPGKSVKGVLKDAAETLKLYNSNEDNWKAFIEEVFGLKAKEDSSPHSIEGSSFFSDAQLSTNVQQSLIENNKKIAFLFKSISSTAIDENGIAKDHTLRRVEYVIPVTLYGTISNIDEKYKEMMKNCFKMIKGVGTGRNRGFGRCVMSEMEVENE